MQMLKPYRPILWVLVCLTLAVIIIVIWSYNKPGYIAGSFKKTDSKKRFQMEGAGYQ